MNTLNKTELEKAVEENAARRQAETMEREMFLGRMTGWRSMKNNSVRTTILRGRHKINALLARGTFARI